MSNRTEAATRNRSHMPPGGYRHCACSRLHQDNLTLWMPRGSVTLPWKHSEVTIILPHQEWDVLSPPRCRDPTHTLLSSVSQAHSTVATKYVRCLSSMANLDDNEMRSARSPILAHFPGFPIDELHHARAPPSALCLARPSPSILGHVLSRR